jgi:hypothetical protein
MGCPTGHDPRGDGILNKEFRRVFFVVGAEGSGTYMLTEALVKAGCFWRQGHESHLEDYRFDKVPSPFVFHRSLPHAGEWPDLRVIVPQAKEAFDEFYLLYIFRDFYATQQSVLNRDPSRDPHEIFAHQVDAFVYAGWLFGYQPLVPVNVPSLAVRGATSASLSRRL